jgi:hypothetical protein
MPRATPYASKNAIASKIESVMCIVDAHNGRAMSTTDRLSAQVILRTSDIIDADRVKDEFRRHQFEVGPFIANNFSISGTREVFVRYFGEEAVNTPGRTTLPIDELPDDLMPLVETLGFTSGYESSLQRATR